MNEKPANDKAPLGAQGRSLMRGARTVALSTLLAENGAPYGSLVLSATCPDATPILLLSKLAVHTANLLRDGRASLLYDATAPLDDPLTGARLSVIGTIRPTPKQAIAADRARFLARHPSAADYTDFGDFGFYRLLPERAHLVAGFGRIHWIEGVDLRLPQDIYGPLAEAEPDILAHMNRDHAGAIALYAENLLGCAPGPWRMTGCDPEGCDLALGGRLARLDFATLVCDADQARRELARLAQLARMASR